MWTKYEQDCLAKAKGGPASHDFRSVVFRHSNPVAICLRARLMAASGEICWDRKMQSWWLAYYEGFFDSSEVSSERRSARQSPSQAFARQGSAGEGTNRQERRGKFVRSLIGRGCFQTGPARMGVYATAPSKHNGV